MTASQISRIWATGVALGTSVYLIFDSFDIGKHAIGDGIWVGATAVVIMLSLEREKE